MIGNTVTYEEAQQIHDNRKFDNPQHDQVGDVDACYDCVDLDIDD